MKTKIALTVAALALMAAGAATAQAFTTTIYAGQYIEAGTLTVDSVLLPDGSGEVVFVIEANDDWLIELVHIYIGTDPVPTNGGGHPNPGGFPHHSDFSSPTDYFVFSLPLESIGGATCYDPETFNVAVHLDMVTAGGGPMETAWAFGPNPFDKAWGWWFEYTADCGLR